ncbi:hypothetical protein ILFOPFJJ_06993 [Ensifer psoraleae]|nr:hypothetical protein [Sinorhizobium psoraleae]
MEAAIIGRDGDGAGTVDVSGRHGAKQLFRR